MHMSEHDRGLERAHRGPDDLSRGERLVERVAPAVETLPGLARVAGAAGFHTAQWGVRTGLRTSWRVAKALRGGEDAAALVHDATEAVGVVGTFARSVAGGTPLGTALATAGQSLGGIVGDLAAEPEPQRTPATLRERGAALLERSRDVWDNDTSHPAYARILDELAPDEARILVTLLRTGPQPSVDVRTGGPMGRVSSTLVAPGLSMIGARSGVRHLEHVPAYLNNLHRLGLVWFSREPVSDPMEYQVVEAQPDVLAAMHSVRFPKVVRRSIHLTPFGEDFCRTCLVEESQACDDYPDHEVPEGE